jgi:pimeloyl-ACP methyl ester carboxylesterase
MNHRPDVIGPTSNFYVSQRLRLHYVDWGNEGAPTVVLVHGGKDHARNWDHVARELRHDYHVVAPDLRGHGDSAWAMGGTYAIWDFVLDLAQLIEALGGGPVILIGHSLGGAVVLHYAGTFPDRVSKLIAIEGMGPPPEMQKRMEATPAHERIGGWVQSMQGLAARAPRRYSTIDEAAKRMQEANPHLSGEQAHHLTVHGVARNEDGTFSWKFDNYVRAFAPARFRSEDTRSLWERVTCPVLLMLGTESWAKDPEKDGRMSAFADARVVNVEGAGHWVHHDQLEVFLEATQAFL